MFSPSAVGCLVQLAPCPASQVCWQLMGGGTWHPDSHFQRQWSFLSAILRANTFWRDGTLWDLVPEKLVLGTSLINSLPVR